MSHTEAVGETSAALAAALAAAEGAGADADALDLALAAEEEDDVAASLAAVAAQMTDAVPAEPEAEAEAEAAPAGEAANADAPVAAAEAAAEPEPDTVPELASMPPPEATSCSETLFSYLGSGGESTLSGRLVELFSCTLSAALTAAEASDPPAAQAAPAAAEEEAAPEADAAPDDDARGPLLPQAPTADLIRAMEGWRLLSGSADRSLRVWDMAETPACTHVLSGHKNWVHAVCDAGDGRVVSGSDDCTVRVWRLEDCACELVLKGHTGYVTAVCLLPDRRLLSGSDDTTLRVWRLDDGSCERELTGHAGDVTCAVVIAGGELAVSGSRDKTLRVWRVAPDALGRPCAHTLRGHNNTVYALAALPDSAAHVVSAGADSLICLWNAAAGTCERVIEGLRCTTYSLAVMPAADGGALISGSQDGTVAVWRLEDGELLAGMFGHRDAVLSLVPLPNGRVASGSQDGTIRVWHIGAGAQLRRQNHGAEAVLQEHSNWVMGMCLLPPGPPRPKTKAVRKKHADDTSSSDDE